MLDSDIYNAYVDRGLGKLHPAGRFLVHEGEVKHLEDYHGLLSKEIPEGIIDDYSLFKLGHPGSGLKVASQSSIRHGHRLDVLPEADLQPMPQRQAPVSATATMPKLPSVFHYQRAGHDKPHLLEVRDGQHLLDGNPLEHDEVSAILDNVRTKTARLRYAKDLAPLAKAGESDYVDPRSDEDDLGPQPQTSLDSGSGADDMDPQAALAHLDRLDLGDESADAIKALRRHIFEDPMVPGLGNKYAYQEFRKKNVPGVNVVGDANFFKSVNDTYGHEAGDRAIKALGAAWKIATEHTGDGKAHRFGGDEFHVHFPTYEHAAKFARTLRHHLQLVPPVGGTHRLSMSLGIGDDFGSADRALYNAKQRKAGTSPTTVPPILAHSLHPQSVGAVPTDPSELALVRPSDLVRPSELPVPAPSPSTQGTETGRTGVSR